MAESYVKPGEGARGARAALPVRGCGGGSRSRDSAGPRPRIGSSGAPCGGDAEALPAVGSAGRDVPGGLTWRGGSPVSSGLTAPFAAAGNQERGWNDPPQFSYGLQAQAGGSRRTPLTRRAPAPPAGAPPGQPRGAPACPAPCPARPGGAAPCRDPRGAAARLLQPRCRGGGAEALGPPRAPLLRGPVPAVSELTGWAPLPCRCPRGPAQCPRRPHSTAPPGAGAAPTGLCRRCPAGRGPAERGVPGAGGMQRVRRHRPCPAAGSPGRLPGHGAGEAAAPPATCDPAVPEGRQPGQPGRGGRFPGDLSGGESRPCPGGSPELVGAHSPHSQLASASRNKCAMTLGGG